MTPYYETPLGKLYHGDCLEIMPQLEPVDLVVTSPPFNIKKKWWDCGPNGIHKNLAKKFSEEWYPDEMPEDEYQAREHQLIEQALKICNGSVCYNHKVRYAFKRERRSFHPMQWLLDFPLWVEIIWDKGGGPALNCRRPVVCEERIFVFGRPLAWNNAHLTNIWKIAPDRKTKGHPCPFPIGIPANLIQMFTDPGFRVLDYYLGSGTTAIACERLNRKWIGIEIEEKYCEIAARRIELERKQRKLF